MGSTISSTPLRVLAGLGTMGLSEGGGLLPAADAGIDAITPDIPDMPGAPTTDAAGVQAAAADASRRRSRSRSFRSTILRQLTAPSGGGLQETMGS